MKIKTNSNFSLGMSLPQYVEEKINGEISKYLSNATEVNVFFSKDGNNYRTNITTQDGDMKGITIKSGALSDDIYHSFELSLIKTIKQLRKYKSKLLNYRRLNSELKAKSSDAPYVLADRLILKENNASDSSGDFVVVDEDASLFTVMEEKEMEIEKINIEEALMKMDLLSLPAYMFINKANGLMNVIYKKSDNTISWINPKGK